MRRLPRKFAKSFHDAWDLNDNRTDEIKLHIPENALTVYSFNIF
jgi:hypothetical protein